MTLKPQEGSFGSAKDTVASPVRHVPSTRQVQVCQRAELQGEHSSGIAVSGQRHGAYEKNVLNLVLGHLSTVAWLSLDTFCSRRLPYCGQLASARRLQNQNWQDDTCKSILQTGKPEQDGVGAPEGTNR